MTAADDRTLEDLLERLRTRFYGKYRGIVTDVEPSTMRIKAKVPSVLGETKTGWCMPCVPYAGPKVGFAFLPEKGSGVWIEFEGGDVSYPIWVGGYWRTGEFPADVAQQDPAKPAQQVKVIVAAGTVGAPPQSSTGEPPPGLKLVFNDRQGSITLSDTKGNTVTLGSSGLTLANGQSKVVVSSTSVSVNNGALEVK